MENSVNQTQLSITYKLESSCRLTENDGPTREAWYFHLRIHNIKDIYCKSTEYKLLECFYSIQPSSGDIYEAMWTLKQFGEVFAFQKQYYGMRSDVTTIWSNRNKLAVNFTILVLFFIGILTILLFSGYRRETNKEH